MLTNPATGKDRHGVAALVRDVLLCETNKPIKNKFKNYLRSSKVVQNRNSPELNPSNLQHIGILGAADEALLKKVLKKYTHL
jgi:hypothetical protein